MLNLAGTPFGDRRLLYADFTASGRALTFIERYVSEQVLPTYANVHTTASATGSTTTALREGARDAIYDAVKADPRKYVALFVGTGVTGALAKLASSLVDVVDDGDFVDLQVTDDKTSETSSSGVVFPTAKGAAAKSPHSPDDDDDEVAVVSFDDDNDDEAGALKKASDASNNFDDDNNNDEEAATLKKASDTSNRRALSRDDDAALPSPPPPPLKKKVLVLGGPFEHHSNEILWREKPNVEYVSIHQGPDGLADVDALRAALAEAHAQRRSLIIGTFSAGSNVTGIAPSARYKREVNELLHAFGALAIWDYAGAGPYVEIDLSGSSAPDAVVVSAHKFMGGPGASGVLVADREKIFGGDKPPTVPGGGTVDRVSRSAIDYVAALEEREAAGTPGIIQDIRAGLVFQLKSSVTAKAIHGRERAHLERALPQLAHHPKVWLVGSDLRAYWDLESRLGIVSFLVAYDEASFLHPGFVAAVLNDVYGIQSRSGCMCAGPYGHRLFDIDDNTSDLMRAQAGKYFNLFKPGFTRVNFGAFMTDAEVDFLVAAILQIADRGADLLPLYKVDAATGNWVPRRGASHTTPVSFGIDYAGSANPFDDKAERQTAPVAPSSTTTDHFGRYLSEALTVFDAGRSDARCHMAALATGGDFVDPGTVLPGTFATLATPDIRGQAQWLYRTFALPSDVALACLGAKPRQ
mmetsp:Transcript_11604/g.34739  ORF Transcript_11604/g.34739 Transcript_11604/m.34739 type:complete len:695 (+) Transcript_11604:216-2300(+)